MFHVGIEGVAMTDSEFLRKCADEIEAGKRPIVVWMLLYFHARKLLKGAVRGA